MKILVAIDGSQASLRCVNYILDHPDTFGAGTDVSLITVHLPVPSPRARAWLGHDVLQAYYDDEAEQALAPARAAFTGKGWVAKEIKRVGEPAAEIAQAANECRANMIVMGTHGRSALTTLVMGSVATKVVALSAVPVLLVK